MKIILRRFIAFACVVCAFCANAAAPQSTAAVRPDVRVVIDISGSMKQNDPHNLRKPAYEMLIPLFPKNAKAGVWTFGEGVDVMVPLQSISEGWRALAMSRASKITSTSLYTNIPDALERATANPESGYRTSVILLTDGMVDQNRRNKTPPRVNACSTKFCRGCGKRMSPCMQLRYRNRLTAN
jgi:hypothetical protein